MKADKKLSIKIKSKTERRIMDDPDIEMITEWNIQRILYALVVLIVLVILPAYYFSNLSDSDEDKKVKAPAIVNESIIKKQDSIKESPAKKVPANKVFSKQPPLQVSTKEVIPEKSTVDTLTVESSNNTDKEIIPEIVVAKTVQRPASIGKTKTTETLNPHIARAQLAQGSNKLEPSGEIELPLLVDISKAQSATYFTEVINMQGSTVFHEWLKEGKSIYKRKIIIRGKRWRIPTSKLFTITSTGQWQVRIITQQGDILHKIDFSVEKR